VLSWRVQSAAVSLEIGETLGSYEILSLLGRGGMGEVYRARDTRLDRDVAIKVLPAAFGGDPDRLARFEREAKTLASLNHPNIGGIHGLVEAGGVRGLVLELVEGPTLADRIRRGPLPLDEALAIARQIAQALEAAHARGVIHRDLKPANVNVRPDGTVKVLDFGLAKALHPELQDPSRSQSPTLAAGMTGIDTVLGTPAYMSPEQARGRPVDGRADLWAFGCVLFEMLSGQRAFDGESTADTLGRVMGSPPDWSSLPAHLPESVVRLLRRSLSKDPEDRLHHPADARLELAEALQGEDEQAEPRRASEPGAARWLRALLVLVVGTGLGGGAVWLFGDVARPSAERATSRWRLDVGPGELDIAGRSDPLAVSEDGRTLAYVARTDSGPYRLHVRPIDALEARMLEGTEGASNPFFSPDGRWLGYFAGGRLKKVSVAGGAPVDVAAVPLDDLGGTWSREGTIVFCSYGTGLWRVSADGGEPELVAAAAEMESAQVRWPQFLPDGRRILLILQRSEGPRLAWIDVVSGEWETIPGLQGVGKARYLPGGRLVFAQQGELLGARYDPRLGRLLDPPVSLISNVSMLHFGGSANFEVSPSGTLVYAPGAISPELTLTWVDRAGGERPLSDDLDSFVHPDLSPDGSLLVVEVGFELGDRQVQLFDLERKTRSVLSDAGRNAQPVWHPDGRRVALVSDRGGDWDLYLHSLDGRGEPLLVEPLEQWLGAWTPDGAKLVFYQVDPQTARDLWVLDVEDGSTTPFRRTPANERGVNLSPDGRWLAYVSDQSGRDEIYVESFPQGGARWTISAAGGTEPVWSRDGRELFYREERRMMAVPIEVDGDGIAPGLPTPLFEGDYDHEIVGNANYDVAADGRFLMLRRGDPSKGHLMVVLNWDRELEAALGRR
jgi:eukaryotic-like serine/threonine-protein kinase